MAELFDVLAVDMSTHKVRVMATNKTARNAEAVESMAVMNLGVEGQFFVTEPAGKYAENDEWLPEEA